MSLLAFFTYDILQFSCLQKEEAWEAKLGRGNSNFIETQ